MSFDKKSSGKDEKSPLDKTAKKVAEDNPIKRSGPKPSPAGKDFDSGGDFTKFNPLKKAGA